MIGHAAQRNVIEPAARISRNSASRPLHRCGDQRFLNGILCGGKITVTSGNGAEHLRRKLAQQVPDRAISRLAAHASAGGALITWRTSIGIMSGLPPGPGAAEIVAAISCARCGLSTSTIQ